MGEKGPRLQILDAGRGGIVGGEKIEFGPIGERHRVLPRIERKAQALPSVDKLAFAGGDEGEADEFARHVGFRFGPHTSRLCALAASIKLAKSGCGSKGRDFSSG